MLKKRIALLFLIVANSVLLAHTFAPHHHHSKQVCIVSNHCDNAHDEQSTDKINHKHNHENDGESNTEICILKQVFVIRSDRGNNEIQEFSIISLDYINTLLCSPTDNLNLSHQYCFISSHPPNFHSYQGESAVGLRAPPIA